jgi:hypothetical protein
MGIILSSTAALELLLQLATQLAAAALLFSKHQPNPSAASIHDLHSFTAEKTRFKYSFIGIAFLSISAQKRSNFLDFFLYRFLCTRMNDCIFFLMDFFFQGARFTIRFLLIFVQEEEDEEEEEGRFFHKFVFNLENFVLFCFAEEEGGLQIKRRGFADLDSTVVMGQSFQFSFLILEFQSLNRMNTKQLHITKFFECFYYYNKVSTLFCFVLFCEIFGFL